MKDNYWASQDIKALAASGIITGYTDGTFRPNEVITRAEIIAMISRIVDFKAVGTRQTVNFNDIASSWNADDIRVRHLPVLSMAELTGSLPHKNSRPERKR